MLYYQSLTSCVEGMMRESSPKKEQERFSFEKLAAMYGYVPREFPESQTKTLFDKKIHWEVFTDVFLGKMVDRFLANGPSESLNRLRSVFLGTLELTPPAADDQIEMVFVRIDAPNESPKFDITINHRNTQNRKRVGVAEFIFAYTQESNAHVIWDLQHRIVYPPYREQGIATEIIKKFETQCARLANEQSMIHFILASVAQADVLAFFLNRGFEPMAAIDKDRVSRLFSGDPHLTIMDSPTDPSRRAYLFDRHQVFDEKGGERSDMWQISSVTGYPRFLSESFRILLKKSFMPDENSYDRVRRALGVNS